MAPCLGLSSGDIISSHIQKLDNRLGSVRVGYYALCLVCGWFSFVGSTRGSDSL